MTANANSNANANVASSSSPSPSTPSSSSSSPFARGDLRAAFLTFHSLCPARTAPCPPQPLPPSLGIAADAFVAGREASAAAAATVAAAAASNNNGSASPPPPAAVVGAAALRPWGLARHRAVGPAWGTNGDGSFPQQQQQQQRRNNRNNSNANNPKTLFDAAAFSAEPLYRAMEDAARQWVARRGGGGREGAQRHSDLAFFSRGR